MLPSVRILPASPSDIAPVAAPPLSFRNGGCLYPQNLGILLLGEFASSLDLLEITSSIPVVPSLTVIECTVKPPGAKSAPGGGEKAAPLVGQGLIGGNVYYSGISVSPVPGGWCGRLPSLSTRTEGSPERMSTAVPPEAVTEEEALIC